MGIPDHPVLGVTWEFEVGITTLPEGLGVAWASAYLTLWKLLPRLSPLLWGELAPLTHGHRREVGGPGVGRHGEAGAMRGECTIGGH